MPRRNLKRPLPLAKWTDAERARGYRRWAERTGREVVQCAPGRVFSLVEHPRLGAQVVEAGDAPPPPKAGRTLIDLFRGPTPYLCIVLSNEPETGLVFATAMPNVLPKPRPLSGELPDYGEWSVSAPEPRPPLIGPVSAEFLASWVGFNAGRGERFLAEFVFTGEIPARRVEGRTRIWEFEEAALSSYFPRRGEADGWAEMLRQYAKAKARPASRGSYQHHYTPKYVLKRREK
jgi:hypothetical protein